jgi:hypothetical protein
MHHGSFGVLRNLTLCGTEISFAASALSGFGTPGS